MSFELFIKENDLKVFLLEKFFCNENVKWAGTPDIIGLLNDKLVVIDLKTGTEQTTHQIQLNMYADLIQKCCNFEDEVEMYALYTKGKWIKQPSYKLKKAKPNEKVMNATYDIWEYLNTTARGAKPWPKDKPEIQTVFMGIKSEESLEEIL